MASILKFFGAVVIVACLIGSLLTALLWAGLLRTAVPTTGLGWTVRGLAGGGLVGVLAWCGGMAVGAVLYVGGRALQHMDRAVGGDRKRRRGDGHRLTGARGHAAGLGQAGSAAPAPSIAPKLPQPMPDLVVRTAGEPERVVRLTARYTVIGRDAGCEVALTDERASRRHVRIGYSDQGEWVAEDLGSANGTWLGATRVLRSVLKPGDPLRIGQTVLTLRFGAASRAAYVTPAPTGSRRVLRAAASRRSALQAGAGAAALLAGILIVRAAMSPGAVVDPGPVIEQAGQAGASSGGPTPTADVAGVSPQAPLRPTAADPELTSVEDAPPAPVKSAEDRDSNARRLEEVVGPVRVDPPPSELDAPSPDEDLVPWFVAGPPAPAGGVGGPPPDSGSPAEAGQPATTPPPGPPVFSVEALGTTLDRRYAEEPYTWFDSVGRGWPMVRRVPAGAEVVLRARLTVKELPEPILKAHVLVIFERTGDVKRVAYPLRGEFRAARPMKVGDSRQVKIPVAITQQEFLDDGGAWTSKVKLVDLTKMLRVRVLSVVHPDGALRRLVEDTEDSK